jgi:deoxycytidylate deaminase
VSTANPVVLPLDRLSSDSDTGPAVIAVEERITPELVVALVGPVGCGVTTSGELIRDILKDGFGYECDMIKASDFIKENARLLGDDSPVPSSGVQRVERLQTIGNGLRKAFGADYLARKCVEHIAKERHNNGYDTIASGTRISKRRRIVHIIDSIKNPAEFTLLRRVYGDLFWLFAIFAPFDVRRTRLAELSPSLQELDRIIERDEDERETFGQKVRDSAHLADFFVRNDGTNTDSLKATIVRFIDIIFGVGVQTPTRHESAMYEAAAHAARSACLSRQVGAAIVSRSGELIGVGCNDVPKAGGGLYRADDTIEDNRCYKWGRKVCHNDEQKAKIAEEVFNILMEEKFLADNIALDDFKIRIAKTKMKNLIELLALHDVQAVPRTMAR